MKRSRRRTAKATATKRPHSLRRRLQIESLESRHVLATFDLEFADLTIFGVDANDESGIAVSNAGDVDGDGFDDLLIGARYGDAANNAKGSAGDSYLVFGSDDFDETSIIDLATLGSQGVTFFGADIFDYSGRALSTAGDVNGDGFDDILIGAVEADGANNNEPQAGESYIVFGKANWSTTPIIDFASLGSNGVVLYGTDVIDLSGRAVSNAGDVNGDGFDDVLIGAHYGDGTNNGRPGAGESILLFGRSTWSTTIDLGNLGPMGVTLFGAEQGDDSGIAVSGAGDVNGDGFDDLVIGARYADSSANGKNSAGDSYIVFGKANWSSTLTLDLANLGSGGVTLFGADIADYSGLSVSNAGDVDGDGFDDLLIGAVGGDLDDNQTPNAGETYLLFGRANWPATVDLSDLGSDGVTFYGADTLDNSGLEVSNAGDINGDGFDDLLIGARYGDGIDNTEDSAGESYLVFGRSNWSSSFFLGNIGSAGVVFFGPEATDYSGFSVSTAGDLNGDGFDDLIIGAAGGDAVDNAKESAGESYVIFGGDDFTSSVTDRGTAAAETITGSNRADIMVGHRGSDLMIGSGGADVLRGGQGNDILAVSDLTYHRIVGGSGTDTLRLDSSGLTLDLTIRRDNRTQGLEQIDITGSGANTLTLNVLEVLNLSDESNMLIVFRDANDQVNIGSGWTQGPNEEIGGKLFEVFTQGQAILKIQTTIAEISITKTASASIVLAGTSFFYTVEVTNDGPSTATGVVVTDSLPTGLAFDSVTSSNACSAAGRVVTCVLGSISADESKQAQIGVRVASSLPHGSEISNTATVTINESDPTPNDHSATVAVTVNRQADLAATVVALPDPAVAGGPLNFSILIENGGPSDASNVVVTSTLPPELTFFANGSTGNCSAVGQLVTCNVGTVAAGLNTAPRIGTIVNPSLTSGAEVTNTVSVTLSETDPTPDDHSDTATVIVNRQTNLRVSNGASQNPVVAGGSFRYMVEVFNLGPSNASGVVVTDTLADGLSFDSNNSSNICGPAGQLITCSIGDMLANANLTLTIAVDVSSSLARGTVLDNTATISGNEFDPTPNDQNSSVSVTVNVDPDPFPWQNVVNHRDVNNDRSVTPIDALVVINELNSPRYSTSNGQLPVPAPPETHPYFDVSGDNFAAPNDVLIVINFLNSNSGEGEEGGRRKDEGGRMKDGASGQGADVGPPNSVVISVPSTTEAAADSRGDREEEGAAKKEASETIPISSHKDSILRAHEADEWMASFGSTSDRDAFADLLDDLLKEQTLESEIGYVVR